MLHRRCKVFQTRRDIFLFKKLAFQLELTDMRGHVLEANGVARLVKVVDLFSPDHHVEVLKYWLLFLWLILLVYEW